MLHVLILEDDSIIALDIKSIIDEMGGFNTFIAVDMQSALKIAAKHHINKSYRIYKSKATKTA